MATREKQLQIMIRRVKARRGQQMMKVVDGGARSVCFRCRMELRVCAALQEHAIYKHKKDNNKETNAHACDLVVLVCF